MVDKERLYDELELIEFLCGDDTRDMMIIFDEIEAAACRALAELDGTDKRGRGRGRRGNLS